MQAPYFPDWRGVYRSEHLPGILCTSRNVFWLHPCMMAYLEFDQLCEKIFIN